MTWSVGRKQTGVSDAGNKEKGLVCIFDTQASKVGPRSEIEGKIRKAFKNYSKSEGKVRKLFKNYCDFY